MVSPSIAVVSAVATACLISNLKRPALAAAELSSDRLAQNWGAGLAHPRVVTTYGIRRCSHDFLAVGESAAAPPFPIRNCRPKVTRPGAETQAARHK
ncbi:hypothetical protein HYPDE_33718 [Hyphomicrobium denitrificans 1NES1]|uniref:Uncharacterized protein n=1 Tax=Hyphomicrobium denitrificans 1NES1 TaxID=670307 RepID=N0BD11_9HYPH|nr:hypothetical protein HYPDE_33718 [Hyphomicrobium denitrificans 1NES1]